jgi:hypothetical protein
VAAAECVATVGTRELALWSGNGGTNSPPVMLTASQNVLVEQKIECASTRCAKNFLTFAIGNSFVVTLVPRLEKFDHHFFLDFIFQ